MLDHFSDHAHDADPQGDRRIDNPDPPSIFWNDTVRTVVVRNLVDLRISANTAVRLLRVHRHAVEPIVRAEFPEGLKRWETSEALARWIGTHVLIGSYQHSPHTYSKCIRAMALRGDEDFSRGDELLWLRVAYEVNFALTKLLRMDAFLAQAYAVGRVWTSLLWPVCPLQTDSRFTLFVRTAFSERLGLPHHDAPGRFFQEYLYDLTRPVDARTTGATSLDADDFARAISRRYRPLIPGVWPLEADVRVREILLSRTWEGQEAAEVGHLCYQSPKRERVTISDLDEQRTVMRAATNADRKTRQRAYDAICAWLVETHPDLADLVRPLRP
ncbi:MAG: hypothetical protein WCO25_06360 [Candidatus Uhrbacteria bacterium]